jgi:hypothetical protein
MRLRINCILADDRAVPNVARLGASDVHATLKSDPVSLDTQLAYNPSQEEGRQEEKIRPLGEAEHSGGLVTNWRARETRTGWGLYQIAAGMPIGPLRLGSDWVRGGGTEMGLPYSLELVRGRGGGPEGALGPPHPTAASGGTRCHIPCNGSPCRIITSP